MGHFIKIKVENEEALNTNDHDVPLLKNESLPKNEEAIEIDDHHVPLLKNESLPKIEEAINIDDHNVPLLNESLPKIEEAINIDDHNVPLLNESLPEQKEKSFTQKAISQTFLSTAHLANLLPTGSILAFQLLSPIFTNEGECETGSRFMTTGLISLCALSCILLSFTDSFKENDGNVCYGFITFKGMWVIDGSTSLPKEKASKYKIKFIDFLHAFMSVLVFGAVAMFNQNVVSCLYPTPSKAMQEVLKSLPVGVGVICSMLFVVFPTKRHGIGFPISAHDS